MTSQGGSGRTASWLNETQSYKDLVVWQKGISLAKLIYRLTSTFPLEEKSALYRRCAARRSIPSNIAEGQARHTTGEFIQFIFHAEGSAAELETQLILSAELAFCLRDDAIPAYENRGRDPADAERTKAEVSCASVADH
ncbi:MAG: four helix bundle protein [Chthoniobacterales bacterium]|nr:four helix bundle protein [Chthoniobacterales bacterium]